MSRCEDGRTHGGLRSAALAGERNAAMHTSWVVTIPGNQFAPASQIPTHGALKSDFVSQFQLLRQRLNDQFFALNEVRKAFARQQEGDGQNSVP
jgi:hypothetical protein